MIIITLLAIITVSEITRLYLAFRKIGKKRYFRQKREGVEKMIWDFEFKRFKTKEIREEIRKEYDNRKSRLFQLEERIKAGPLKDQSKEDFAKLGDEKDRLNKEIEGFAGQMKTLDVEIAGSKPTQEYQEGVAGINQQIDSLIELKVMLEDWIKKQ